MKTKLTQTAPGTRALVDFEISDAKGRKIGVSIFTATIVAEVLPDDWKGCFSDRVAPGEWIALRISPTRDGQDFGPTQQCNYFKTQAEADLAIAKRIESTRARYGKKFSA